MTDKPIWIVVARLVIELNVECPACGKVLDLVEVLEEHAEIKKLELILNQVLGDWEFAHATCEYSTTCIECNSDFDVKSVTL